MKVFLAILFVHCLSFVAALMVSLLELRHVVGPMLRL